MTAVNQNLVVYRGDTESVEIDLTAADGSPFAPDPGATMRYAVAWNNDSEALIDKSLGNGLTLITGGVSISLSSNDTDITPGLYYHELKIFDAGDVYTAMTGYFTVRNALQLAP